MAKRSVCVIGVGMTKFERCEREFTELVSEAVTGALAVAERLLANSVRGGAYTPAKLVGADLVTHLPGSGPFQMT